MKLFLWSALALRAASLTVFAADQIQDTARAAPQAQPGQSTPADSSAAGLRPGGQIVRSSQLRGAPILSDGRSIGRMEDMVVDVRSGRITYGINSFENLQGAGNNLYPVPWSAGAAIQFPPERASTVSFSRTSASASWCPRALSQLRTAGPAEATPLACSIPATQLVPLRCMPSTRIARDAWMCSLTR